MNEKISTEDQDWLDALSGKTLEGVDPLISAQALAVRKALTSRRDAIESDSVRVGDSGLNEIRARLQREGLMKPEKSNLRNGWWNRAMDIFGMGTRGGGAKAIPIWGVAAMLLVAVLVTFQIQGPDDDQREVYRGDASVTTLIVDNPQQKASELRSVLKPLTESVDVSPLSYGRFQLKVKDSQKVRDYLTTQRIEPIVVDGYITIDVIPKKK